MTRRFPKTIDPSITSWTELASHPTTDLAVPCIIGWVNSDDDRITFTELRDSTEASDPTNGIQRPDDYAASTNEVVWFKVN